MGPSYRPHNSKAFDTGVQTFPIYQQKQLAIPSLRVL